MLLQKRKIFMVAGCFMVLFGCRANFLFDYSSAEFPIAEGVLSFELRGTYEEKEENGKKVRFLSKPYSLIIHYLSDYDNFSTAEITQLEIKSTRTKEVTSFPGKYREKILGKGPDGKYSAGFSFRDLMIEYEEYEISGKFILYLNDKILSAEQFKVILKKSYTEKKTIDFIDRAMGV